MSQYDYLVVGAGLSGAVFANAARRAGKSVLVIDRRDHIAGNVYTEDVEGIQVHRYGAHIFHTSMRDVWDYVNRFAEFNNYVNSPVANFHGSMYNMPFNMNTFAKMWPGVVTPADAKAKIAEQVAAENIGEPANLEEQALSLVGRDIFETLVKGYTEKQWGRDCRDLPASIIKRLPCRFTYDNNYFNDRYQGIPMGGYTEMVANMLEGVEVRCGVEYKELAAAEPDIAAKTIYCGPIDAFYDFKLGTLEYRSLRFETETLDEADHQGVAVVNYTEREIPYTRSSSTSTSSSARRTRPSSRASTRPTGSPATSPTTPSTTPRTRPSTVSTRSWRRRRATLSSPVAWAATSTTTWTRPSPQPSISSATS